MFVGVVSAASMAASAAGSEIARNANFSLAVANIATNEDVQTQAAKAGSIEVRRSLPQDANNSETTLPATGWLLVMALFGFVMLSNRLGV